MCKKEKKIWERKAELFVGINPGHCRDQEGVLLPGSRPKPLPALGWPLLASILLCSALWWRGWHPPTSLWSGPNREPVQTLLHKP